MHSLPAALWQQSDTRKITQIADKRHDMLQAKHAEMDARQI
jgi:hypothetical protein